MPAVLRFIADWNPVSAVTAAARHLWGNPNPSATIHAWPMQHPVAASLLCCRLMNIEPQGVPLLRTAIGKKMGPSRSEEILLNTPIEPFLSGVNYTVKTIPLTYITKAAFHSRALTTLLYDSAPGRFLNRCLRRLRKLELFRFLIYRNQKFVE